MSKVAGKALFVVLLLFACSAGFVLADETRAPTPEEFREQVRQYNESRKMPGSSRQRPMTPQVPKAVEQFQRAMSIHMKKDATPAEMREAAALYQAASDAGLPQASTNLAFLYLEGKGMKKDVRKAVSLLNIASKKNIPQADLALARLYLAGKDVKRDEKKGEWHLNKAAGTGDKNAVRMLAEYRDWKKKNELAMKQYREIMKKAQMNAGKAVPQSVTVSPFQPAAGGYPFPVIPGQAYLGTNQAAVPSVSMQPPPSAPPDKNGSAGNAAIPQPAEIRISAPAGGKPAIQGQPKAAGDEKIPWQPGK